MRRQSNCDHERTKDIKKPVDNYKSMILLKKVIAAVAQSLYSRKTQCLFLCNGL